MGTALRKQPRKSSGSRVVVPNVRTCFWTLIHNHTPLELAYGQDAERFAHSDKCQAFGHLTEVLVGKH